MAAKKVTAIDALRDELALIDEHETLAGSIETTDIARALVEIDGKLEEVFARVKKSNSLVGMMLGRLPQPKRVRR